MIAYVGQTRSRALMARLEAAGIGECVTRGDLPPRRGRWFYDNGAFEDWRAGQPFNYLQFSRDMRAIRLWRDAEGIPSWRPRGGQSLSLPDFIVIPDVVADGAASLRFSADHVEECRAAGAPLYLAVQDGMTPGAVRAFVREHGIAGLFVGGSLEWKLRAAPRIVALARELGIKVHVGRVGTFDRVRWAISIGVDSIDSCLPLWSGAKLDRFLSALEAPAVAA